MPAVASRQYKYSIRTYSALELCLIDHPCATVFFSRLNRSAWARTPAGQVRKKSDGGLSPSPNPSLTGNERVADNAIPRRCFRRIIPRFSHSVARLSSRLIRPSQRRLTSSRSFLRRPDSQLEQTPGTCRSPKIDRIVFRAARHCASPQSKTHQEQCILKSSLTSGPNLCVALSGQTRRTSS